MGNLKYNCVLFDLDGTLVDSLQDLTNSLNRVLTKYNFKTCSTNQVKMYLGNGYKKLIERSINNSDNSIVCKLLNDFTNDYNLNCLVDTKPYPGILELLNNLKLHDIKTAIISNKNDEAVQQIYDMYFNDIVDYYCGIKPGYQTKPNLDIYYDIINHLNANNKKICLVGDSNVDIQTANNANIDCISVTWGFRDELDLLNFGAKIICRNITDLNNLLL